MLILELRDYFSIVAVYCNDVFFKEALSNSSTTEMVLIFNRGRKRKGHRQMSDDVLFFLNLVKYVSCIDFVCAV